MLRKRSGLILALSLVSFGVLFVTFKQQKTTLENLYPVLIPKNLVIPSAALVPSASVFSSKAGNKNCSSGTWMFENYCVITPYQSEVNSTANAGLITLCTQGTVEFLHHVAVLCQRWSAPISVAVYSPEDDYVDAMLQVQLLRQCDFCIRYWVNWHFFFPSQKVPGIEDFQFSRDCSSITRFKRLKKRRSQGTYPINVGRNIARRLTHTPFIFSIDIELYPSLNIPSKFQRMLRSQVSSQNGQVWVIPVFEVHSKSRAPLLKSQLKSMFLKNTAISFHQYRCNICHRIPNLTQWINHEEGTHSELEESLEPLRIWTTVKRNSHYKLQYWEPFFIGTTKDPEFDIRLSWEGKQNKMQMAYEMCMRNYDFHIIENAFLVHTPGINVYNATKEKERNKYVHSNTKIIQMVKKDLIKKHGSKNDC